MKTLVVFLFLGSLGLAWCRPKPGAFNIARTGEASQSSDYHNDTPIDYAYNAKEPNWINGFCPHTNNDQSPWWKVDMKRKYKVNAVVLTGRSYAVMERLIGAEVRIGNSPDNNNPVCGKVTKITNPTLNFFCDEMEGQYVSVVIPGRSEYLHLYEVEICIV
ncbi:pentraxin fusion protein-like [Lithobates pipiens]